jgi:hypothetical protein
VEEIGVDGWDVLLDIIELVNENKSIFLNGGGPVNHRGTGQNKEGHVGDI